MFMIWIHFFPGRICITRNWNPSLIDEVCILGTLTRNKSEYRTPPVVAPPQVPSNYAPNYPKTSRSGQQYGTLPHQHPQVGMVYPQPQEGGATMPRLSSHSIRSTHSANSGTPTPPPHEGTYGVTRKVIKTS